MNDKNWQLTRNLYVCSKHFASGDKNSGVPDFGPPVSEEVQDSSTSMDTSNPEGQPHLTTATHIPIQVGAEVHSGHVQVEEIEVDAADWLPKAVSHQFKEQFIGNDPRYVAIVKDNIVMHVPHQEMKKSITEKNIYLDSSPSKTHAGPIIFPDGKENTMLKENVKVEGKRFIQTETGEVYEILSMEEPQENMVNQIII